MIYIGNCAEKDKKVARLRLFVAVMFFIFIPSVFGGTFDGIRQTTENMTLTEEDRAAVIEKTAVFMEENYVLPEKGKLIADFLREQQRKGRYANLNNPLNFADIVTADLKTVSMDSHLGLSISQG